MVDPRPIHPALRVAARHGLPDRAHGAGTVGLDAADADEVLARARFDRTTGLLAAALLDGTIPADDATVEAAVAEWRQALRAAVLVEAFAVRTADELDAAGVRWRLTKGAALAHLDYRDQLAERIFGDVDLVIHPDDWALALDVLGRAGLRRPAPELRPGYDLRFGKGATLVDERGWEIDLHLRFAIGRFGVRSRMAELFERGDEIELAARTIPVLAGPDRLLHASHHLVLGGFSALRAARDVAQLVLVSEVDWGRTVVTATEWRVDAVVATGIVQAWDRLELDVAHPAHAWAVDHPIGRGDARAIEVFAEERPFREQALTAVPALPWRQIPAYLWSLTFPNTDSLRQSRQSPLDHASRAAIRVLGRRARQSDVLRRRRRKGR